MNTRWLRTGNHGGKYWAPTDQEMPRRGTNQPGDPAPHPAVQGAPSTWERNREKCFVSGTLCHLRLENKGQGKKRHQTNWPGPFLDGGRNQAKTHTTQLRLTAQWVLGPSSPSPGPGAGSFSILSNEHRVDSESVLGPPHWSLAGPERVGWGVGSGGRQPKILSVSYTPEGPIF